MAFRPPLPGDAVEAPAGPLRRVLAAVRPILSGPFVRTWLRLRRLRLFFAPIDRGTFERDPFKALKCKEDAGYRCRACGAGHPVEAAHDVPLAFGGPDVLENMRCLCVRCHEAEDKVERRIRSIRNREVKDGVSDEMAAKWWSPVVRLKWWQKIGLLVFLAGLIDGRFWMFAAGGLVVATVGVWWVAKRGRKLSGRQRGPGIDGLTTFDKMKELQTTTGYDHFVTNRYYGWRRFWWQVRYVSIGACSAYLAGHFLISALGYLPTLASTTMGAFL